MGLYPARQKVSFGQGDKRFPSEGLQAPAEDYGELGLFGCTKLDMYLLGFLCHLSNQLHFIVPFSVSFLIVSLFDYVLNN